MKTYKEELQEEYDHLCNLFGIGSGLWDSLFCHYSPSVFCQANRKRIIAQYLLLEDFVTEAKKVNLIYYKGIDYFLEEYKKVVYENVISTLIIKRTFHV